jgi:transcriptional regulator with XRE-family HTH domain
MGFRDNLKSQLAFSNMPVKELAALSGVKKATLDSYLNYHRRMPSADAALRIARTLGVTVEQLFGEGTARGDQAAPERRQPRLEVQVQELAMRMRELAVQVETLSLTRSGGNAP